MYQKTATWLLVLVMSCSLSVVRAQQVAQFSLFSQNQLFFNPATAGSDNLTRLQLVHRNQYSGYQGTLDAGGAPVSSLFSASTSIKNISVGFYVLDDRIGPMSTQDVQLSAAYRIPTNNGTFSVGVRGGLYRNAIDFNQLRPNDPNDPLIGAGVIGQTQPDVSVGVHYQNQAYFVGLSATHILSPSFPLGTGGENPLRPVYYLNGGVLIGLGYLAEIRPIVLLKTDASSFSIEGGVTFTYNNRYWIGATYRQQDAFILMGGMYLLPNRSIRLGGAFDLVTTGQSVKSPLSYEILLSYDLPKPKFGKKTIVRTPRFRY